MQHALIECAKTYTNEATHKIVLGNQHLLPDYDGADGAGVGPRYCPSIFKKVQRFPDKVRRGHWICLGALCTRPHTVTPTDTDILFLVRQGSAHHLARARGAHVGPGLPQRPLRPLPRRRAAPAGAKTRLISPIRHHLTPSVPPIIHIHPPPDPHTSPSNPP